jgi:hypothetical protein
MERLEEGHFHPKLEVSRLTCLGQAVVRGEHFIKELIEQHNNSYSEHLHMSQRKSVLRIYLTRIKNK